MFTRLGFLAVLTTVLVACATSQKAETAVNARFVGQPVDSFFARYGAPRSSYALNNGGSVYRWRGGETSKAPLDDGSRNAKPLAAGGGSSSSTSSHTSSPQPGTTVTESSTTTVSGGFSIPQSLLVPPKPPIPIFCEADISADAKGIITGFHVSQDTEGVGFSISRCAEVFDVN